MSQAAVQFPVSGDDDPSLDWSHFNQMTLGDFTLAREVLTLFDAQAAHIAKVISDLPPNADMLLHGLKGAARSIGAWEIAAAAQELENRLKGPRDKTDAVAVLIDHISRVRTAIAPYI